MRSAVLLLTLPLAAGACNGTSAAEPAAGPESFDGQRAWKDLVFLCEEIGMRRIGTPGAARTRAWLKQEVGGLPGWTVETDPFTARPPEGARRSGEIPGVNVIARRAGTADGELWIASHYDTYDLQGFVGANDAGSSTVVLVELARQLAGEGPRDGMDLVLVWFDGEEPFPPAAWDDHRNSTFGSRHLAARLVGEERVDEVRALVLLDMVGDEDLGLSIESQSDPELKRIFERTAHALGDKQLFVGQRRIKDDHMHFVSAGVPSIDLIDFNFGPSNRYWHTREDVLARCSPKSLDRVGTLVLAALPALERAYAGG